MHKRAIHLSLAIAFALTAYLVFCLTSVAQPTNTAKPPRRNVIIFVADGLRPGSVNEKDAPTLWAIRQQGVNFVNSHSLFPTVTTANASAIATGHLLGDTGDFGNALWVGYPTFDTANFNLPRGTPTPFIESDEILSDLDGHFGKNYLNEPTLLSVAAENGYNTAAIGKMGPTAIQQIEVIAPVLHEFPLAGAPVIIDDLTGAPIGSPQGVPLSVDLQYQLQFKTELFSEAPTRSNGYEPKATSNNENHGDPSHQGTLQPNKTQQQWFADVTTSVILPRFERDAPRPFVLLFWSRDPDGTQHNQDDSFVPGAFQRSLNPGINGETSRLAVRNADNNLRQILDWLDAHPGIKANTDVFVTSDHGFATISREEITRTGRRTSSEAAKHQYFDSSGNLDTEVGTLPYGFLAIDLAVGMGTNLFDPDQIAGEGSPDAYRKIPLFSPQNSLLPEIYQHPIKGNAMLGPDVREPDGSDARAIVTPNGGADLIYVPDKNPDTVHQIVSLLTTYDYVGGIFVDDQYGAIPGTLPLSAIGLAGSSLLPRPAIAVAFKVFYLNPNDLQSAVQISDTNLQEGQGNHGGFGRECTFNNMAAIGPDFKPGFTDTVPVSNADIAPTIAHILGLEMPSPGALKGRVLLEALRGGADTIPVTIQVLASPAPANGKLTVLQFQEAGGERYLDRACYVDTAGAAAANPCQ